MSTNLTRSLTAPLTGPVTRGVTGAGVGRAFNPASLFAGGEQGVLYDFTDAASIFVDAAGTTPITLAAGIGRVTDKSGRGNHATQTATASKPALSARVNQITYSEQLDNAVWTKQRVSVTPNTHGVLDKVVEDTTASNSHRLVMFAGSYLASTYTVSMDVKAAERSRLRLVIEDGPGTSSVNAFFNIGTGTLESTGTNGTALSSPVATITPKADGVYRITLTGTFTGSGTLNVIVFLRDDEGNASYTGDGVSGMHMGCVQFERSPTATRYQRVTTATDYDTAGFPLWSEYDGFDDFLVTPAINFTGTDKVTVVVGLLKGSDAAAGVVCELGTSAFTVGGSFSLEAPSTNGAANTSGRQRGATTTVTQVATIAAPATYVATGQYDIGSPSIGVRLNGVLTGPTTASTGGGSFVNAALYIGRRAGTSVPFNGRIHRLLIIGRALTPAELAAAERWAAQPTGVTL